MILLRKCQKVIDFEEKNSSWLDLALPRRTAKPTWNRVCDRSSGDRRIAACGRVASRHRLETCHRQGAKPQAPIPGSLIIGADQVADLGGTAIGKPGTRTNALAQLEQMRGRTLVFHSGLALLNSETGHVQSRHRCHHRALSRILATGKSKTTLTANTRSIVPVARSRKDWASRSSPRCRVTTQPRSLVCH